MLIVLIGVRMETLGTDSASAYRKCIVSRHHPTESDLCIVTPLLLFYSLVHLNEVQWECCVSQCVGTAL